MKKLLGISLLLIYLLSTTGVAIASHFCCNKLSSVSLVLSSAAEAHDVMQVSCNKDCCKDNVRFYKLQTDHNAAAGIAPMKPLVSHLLPVIAVFSGLTTLPEAASFTQSIHSPPLITATPLFIQLSVFRI